LIALQNPWCRGAPCPYNRTAPFGDLRRSIWRPGGFAAQSTFDFANSRWRGDVGDLRRLRPRGDARLDLQPRHHLGLHQRVQRPPRTYARDPAALRGRRRSPRWIPPVAVAAVLCTAVVAALWRAPGRDSEAATARGRTPSPRPSPEGRGRKEPRAQARGQPARANRLGDMATRRQAVSTASVSVRRTTAQANAECGARKAEEQAGKAIRIASGR
jgi:hypothetical protein